MKIFVAADHGAFDLKEHIKQFLTDKGYEVEDCGAKTYDKDDDYPDFIDKAAKEVAKNQGSMGIIFGGSGQAEQITANKTKGIRCALFYSPAIAVESVDVTGRKSNDPFEIINLAREHNNCNMLSLSGRFLDRSTAEQAVERFINTAFPGEQRHVRRINKISKIEGYR